MTEEKHDAVAAVMIDGHLAGTAFLVARDLAGTAAHVVEPVRYKGQVHLRFPWDDEGHATVWALDSKRDAAVLQLKRSAPSNVAPLPLNKRVYNDVRWHTFRAPSFARADADGIPVPMHIGGAIRDTSAKGGNAL